jgi:hypothetical protein
MDLTTTAQENALNAIETTKAYWLESFKAVAATTKRVLPTMPQLPEMTPMIDPMEAVSTTYDFAEKLLAAQRSMVEEVVATLSPMPSSAS